ncbi:MAG: penicillin acylase family protein [Acidobacteriota bacterium]
MLKRLATLSLLAIVAFTFDFRPATEAAVTVRDEIEGLAGQARVERDRWGVPHITAQSETDLYFMQGWIHAADRFFQMDVTRRQASGTLAEILGPPAMGNDVQLRTLGLRRAAERSWGVLTPVSQAHLEAYARGVNTWLATHPLPIEYGALELTQTAPWTPVDSLVIAKAIAFNLSFDLDIEASLTLAAYQQGLGAAGAALYFEDLFRSAPFDPASTVPDAARAALPEADAAIAPATIESTWKAAVAAAPPMSAITADLAQKFLDRASRVPMLESALRPLERIEGSNEWGVSAGRTRNRMPLLANDPHLALDSPATFYPVHLRTADGRLDAQGSSFAGVPFLVQGQNRFISWGSTTNPMDVTDTFQETLVPDATSPSGLSTVYMGNLEPVIPLPQVFIYNQIGDSVPDNGVPATPGSEVGGVTIPPAVLIVPRRNNGPIVELDTAAGSALSVQYTGFSATREIDAFRFWIRARSVSDFQSALRFFDVGSQNWIVGDIRGNIAYFTSAEMPIREDLQQSRVEGLPPYFIRNGSGGNEWLPVANPQPGQAIPYEILSAEEMPQLINPASGYFVNANNDPAGTTLDNDPLNQLRSGGGIYYLNAGYAQGTRAGRITQALKAKLSQGRVTAADMREIQGDTVLLDAQALVPYILTAYENAHRQGADPALVALADNAGVAEAVNRLAHWDFSTPTGIAAGYDAGDRAGLAAPSADEVAYSVAATIYSVWRGQALRNTIDSALGTLGLPGPGSGRSMIALRHLLDVFATQQGRGASGIDFFPVDGVEDAATRRDIVLLDSLRDALDLLAGPAFETAFHGSTQQDDYRWGYLHRIVFDHPLGGPFSVPMTDPLPGLRGIPVDGGFGVVDASSHSARADSVDDFMFGAGPVRRYVGELGGAPGQIYGETSLPGGSSGVLTSRWFGSILDLWLRNATYPILQRHDELQPLVTVRTVYEPKG